MPSSSVLDVDQLSTHSTDSSQDGMPDDLGILSQAVASSQNTISDSPGFTRGLLSWSRKRESVSSDSADADKIAATAARKRITQSPQNSEMSEDEIPASSNSKSTGRLVQLQARGSAKIYKINESRLIASSDLWMHQLFHEMPPAQPSTNGNTESETEVNDTEASTPINPSYPLIILDVDNDAIFLYCLWKMAPDRLALYIDSTIPRPSTEFVIYLYRAFLLAIELKDCEFLTNLVAFILKDSAGEPSEYAITWAYENTKTGSMLREFVVDCTLTWADEAQDEWRALAQGVPQQFLVDVTCRLMELGLKRKYGLVKTDVAYRFTFSEGWPIEDLKKTAIAAGIALEDTMLESD